MLPANLVGQSDTHLCSASDAEALGVRIHQDIVEPFAQLVAAAGAQGFDIAVLSGFRGFDQQLSIWNRKASGNLPVLDSHARPLDIARLSEEALVFSILRWSALPGASRHHWGTDLDIYDMATKPEGYEVQLLPEEVNVGGMFAQLHEWLDRQIASDSACGFFRPYDIDRHGVAPERWHVSYAPLAGMYERMLSVELLRASIEEADMLLKDVVLMHLDEIFQRFVINTNHSLG